MSGIFGGLKTEGLEKQEDRVGGGYSPFDTGAYEVEIALAYAGESSAGARNVTFHLKTDDGRDYRETIYITSKGDNFWINDNKKKVPLPGFSVVNNICMVTTEKELADQETEEKVVMIYNFEERKELPTNVHVLTELLGKKLSVGIYNILKNKATKQGDKYVDTAEERNENQIEQVFHEPSKMTVNEAQANEGWDADKAKFYDAWVEKNAGKVRDKRTIKDGQGGTAGKPGQAPEASSGERKSLFGSKD
jgi:hypothetical protein